MEELPRVVQQLNLTTEKSALEKAVEKSAFRKMQQSEINQQQEWKAMRGSRQDLLFVRNGLSNHWTTALTPELAAKIETAWGKKMRMLGYELGCA